MNERSRVDAWLETIGTITALGGSALIWLYVIYSFLIAALGG